MQLAASTAPEPRRVLRLLHGLPLSLQTIALPICCFLQILVELAELQDQEVGQGMAVVGAAWQPQLSSGSSAGIKF